MTRTPIRELLCFYDGGFCLLNIKVESIKVTVNNIILNILLFSICVY